MSAQVSTIRKLYEILENTGFEDAYIKSLVSGKGDTKCASESLKDLTAVLRLAALRSQPLFALLLNVILPLDYLIAFLLGNWAVKYGKNLPSQIDDLAELESLMCAAQTGIVFKESAVPVFVESDKPEDNAYFEGVNVVHPLIDQETCVSNSITVKSDIAIITGSKI